MKPLLSTSSQVIIVILNYYYKIISYRAKFSFTGCCSSCLYTYIFSIIGLAIELVRKSQLTQKHYILTGFLLAKIHAILFFIYLLVVLVARRRSYRTSLLSLQKTRRQLCIQQQLATSLFFHIPPVCYEWEAN